MDLLRWFRFTWAAGIAWDRADQRDARDFSRWLQLSGQDGKGYAPAVRAHSETVLRGFYAYHLEAGTGPVINPFPLDRARRRGRPGAHHNPMENYPEQRSGRYRPRLPSRVPRAVSDDEFNAIFAKLPSNRDRALVAFYVSRIDVFLDGKPAGAAVPFIIGRHVHKAVAPPQVPPGERTGIDYLGLVAAAHEDEAGTGAKLDFTALAALGGAQPGQEADEPGQDEDEGEAR